MKHGDLEDCLWLIIILCFAIYLYGVIIIAMAAERFDRIEKIVYENTIRE